jgi:threonine/homoserine/homoserine lactone efflux protein
MQDLFSSAGTFVVFITASLVLAVTPGPGVLYIVTRSATLGRAAGLASVFGVALGNFGNAALASLGLATIFAVSSTAYLVVKYLGAAYLVYLGVQALRNRGGEGDAGRAEGAVPAAKRRIFLDGMLVALFNPKTALFFAAFVPQFLPRDAGIAAAFLLSATFVGIAATTDTMYALASGALASRLAIRAGAARHAARWMGAGAYFTLGIFAALSKDPSHVRRPH